MTKGFSEINPSFWVIVSRHMIANVIIYLKYYKRYLYREFVSMGASGAQTCRSLGHHLLHLQILRLLVILFAPTDFEAQSSLL